MLYVVGGDGTLPLDGRDVQVAAGSFAVVPRGTDLRLHAPRPQSADHAGDAVGTALRAVSRGWAAGGRDSGRAARARNSG